MGMTDEQYIEIAEKVWGWEIKDVTPASYDGRSFAIKESPNHSWTCYFQKDFPQFIVDEVNSWEGFGRTVEAMSNGNDDQFYSLWIDKHMVEFHRHGFDGMPGKENFQYYDAGKNKTETLIEATHLAALEALKTRK